MSGPRIGSLCSGYGGLEMGVQAVLGGTTAWVSEIDKGACKILAHRFPDVPNIGDMTAVDWSQVEPVDVLCGGTPCQDLSHAGKRAGMTEGTRSNLWVAMREAIATIRPSVVIWENVGGAYSARAASEVEREPGLLGDGAGRPALRALGRVLGDLASLGYDAGWHGIRAADVGAPHGRLRVFVVASLADTERSGRERFGAPQLAGPSGHSAWDGEAPPDASGVRRGAGGATEPREAGSGGPSADVAGRGLLPTPRATDGTKGGPNQRGSSGDLMLPSAVHLLGTPRCADGVLHDLRDPAVIGNPKGRLEDQVALLGTPRASEWKGSGPVGSKSYQHMLEHDYLCAQVLSLIPTPSVADAMGGHERRGGVRGEELLLKGMAKEGPLERWGQYADAIARWERITRPAPAPTELGPKGNPRLSARFSEWLMGVPDGWVTDVPGITRSEALKALGNGVVPQQAEAAIRFLMPHLVSQAVA